MLDQPHHAPPRKAGHILVADEDPFVRATLRDVLESERFDVSEANDGDALRALAGAHDFDLITLDVVLPAASGLVLAAELRRSSNVPIIFVSARGSDVDRIVGLEIGADDYIVKPVNVREFIARVRAVLRRYRGAQAEPPDTAAPLYFLDGRFNPQTRTVSSRSGRTTLTAAESDLLEFLLRNAGRICTRDEISAGIKGHAWTPFDRSLDTLVARLRRKIEPDPDTPTLILSVRGAGYRFSAGTRSVSQ